MRHRACAALAIATLCASGCDWVDSTGVQPGDARTDAPPVALGEVAPGEAIELNEGTTSRIRTPPATIAPATGGEANGDVAPTSWRWEEAPLVEGALESCEAFDGFDAERAPDTLAAACTSADDCTFSFVPVDGDAGGDPGSDPGSDDAGGGAGTGDGSVAFELGVPALRSPIGRRQALVESAPDGTELSRLEIDFCLVAINEAPLAMPDAYVLPAGGALDVDAADGVLANDEDDVDTSNAPLSVSEVPSREPARAALLELRADGSFTYEPVDPDGAGDDVGDSFEYEVSDGLQSSFATVTIDPAASPVGPVAVDGAPDLAARVGTFVFVDLSGRFVAPAGTRLTFAFAEALPVDGTLGLADNGTLSGVAGPGDVGTYELTLLASDGTNVAESPLVLVVEPGAGASVPAPSAPIATTPAAAPVTPPTAAPVTPPTASPVTPPAAAPVTPPVVAPPVAAPVAPPGAGPAPADDPVTASGPVFVPGSTFDQALRLGAALLPVNPTFDAPVGATLAYASAGRPLPRGVAVDPDTGTVAGRPGARGTFAGLVVEAVDEDGRSAVSEAFAIVVR